MIYPEIIKNIFVCITREALQFGSKILSMTRKSNWIAFALQHQLKRGSSLFWRYYKGPVITLTDGGLMPMYQWCLVDTRRPWHHPSWRLKLANNVAKTGIFNQDSDVCTGAVSGKEDWSLLKIELWWSIDKWWHFNEKICLRWPV